MILRNTAITTVFLYQCVFLSATRIKTILMMIRSCCHHNYFLYEAMIVPKFDSQNQIRLRDHVRCHLYHSSTVDTSLYSVSKIYLPRDSKNDHTIRSAFYIYNTSMWNR